MATSDDHQHLGRQDERLQWDWSRENPVEIVLVAFILILFFAVPRTGCGIDKDRGDYPARSVATDNSAASSTQN